MEWFKGKNGRSCVSWCLSNCKLMGHNCTPGCFWSFGRGFCAGNGLGQWGNALILSSHSCTSLAKVQPCHPKWMIGNFLISEYSLITKYNPIFITPLQDATVWPSYSSTLGWFSHQLGTFPPFNSRKVVVLVFVGLDPWRLEASKHGCPKWYVSQKRDKQPFLGGGNLNMFLFSTPSWGRFPVWLIFFKWVETTN